MRGFFKTFFASLLALIIFTVIGVFILLGIIASATTADKPVVGRDAVLVLDLSSEFKEQSKDNPLDALLNGIENEAPSLYDMVRMIRYAKSDSAIKGIYVLCGNNRNGFAASEELRKALVDFKTSKKFVLAYGEAISQKGYYIGTAADRIYCHPQGGVEWFGYSSSLIFLKGMLDKLEIQPQIFYAGKFKSATEPLRETKMTDANRLQTSVWLGDLYNDLLTVTATARKLDTAKLRSLAVQGAIQTAQDAVTHQLVDGLKYDDEMKREMQDKLKLSPREKINFVTFSDYHKAVEFKESYSDKKIALIYADGDIVSGNGDQDQVGSDVFRGLIRKARLDNDVKAIVFRVNSPGGSSMASDVIWHEITLARKEKPVVVSMGDMAASGGYYIACNADSVFANANTITGSIGVFSIVPNFQSFFKNKLGVTFDGVKTAPFADAGGVDRPLTETEKRFFQAATDSIYHTFKSRVAEGRKKDIGYIDSIAQGRVWTGKRGIEVGLVDRIGTLQDAIVSAARMAKLEEYRIKEYPEKKTLFEQIMSSYKRSIRTSLLKEEVGEEQVKVLQELRKVKAMVGTPQARLPFSVIVR
ncbi:MAG: signal peptide peptidase SppA [Chitinophagaceae bacterium]|nr:signal peptide peptidase SppA [Chitinophagaceae bacterium]MEA3427337.1 signal peptide peptidase SppA [Bacteroidota bacterium]MCA6452607.1 signal peptide peptidase SppA [Chitinophagaceae bacterium]MCA6454777.1 signal peptide peptidase SppA [Chitinophagaceae bacterium]MCA6459430.1 signal peptide peptidase SppA [Chitinophagaceae bacterium]